MPQQRLYTKMFVIVLYDPQTGNNTKAHQLVKEKTSYAISTQWKLSKRKQTLRKWNKLLINIAT